MKHKAVYSQVYVQPSIIKSPGNVTSTSWRVRGIIGVHNDPQKDNEISDFSSSLICYIFLFWKLIISVMLIALY